MTSDNQSEQEALQNGAPLTPVIVTELEKPNQYKPLGEQRKAVRRQEMMVSFLLFGMLSFGMGLALPAITLNQLTDPSAPIHLDKSEASWFASVSSITCPFGSLLTGYLLDKVGRKWTLIVSNLIALTSWALMALTVQQDHHIVFIQLLMSRLLIGLAMGMASSPSGVYSAEIALPKIRTRLILGGSLAISLGVLAVYVLGYFIRSDWHLVASLLLGFQIVSVLMMIPVIETPGWLLSKGRFQEAKASLSYFRGLEKDETHDEVDTEFELLMKSMNSGGNDRKIPFRKSLRLPEVYKPLLIMCGLLFCSQWSGIYVVVVYAVQIASGTESTMDPLLCAVFIGLARVLTTFLLGFILEKMGRRQAVMISAFGMFVCMFLLAHSKSIPIPYFSAITMIGYIVFSALGIWTLPFFIAAEVFPQNVRGVCSGLIGFFVYVMAFLILKAHPYFVDWMGYSHVLMFYALVALLSVLFVYFCLPETKGKTLQDIEEYFRTGKKGVQERAKEIEMQDTFLKTKA